METSYVLNYDENKEIEFINEDRADYYESYENHVNHKEEM